MDAGLKTVFLQCSVLALMRMYHLQFRGCSHLYREKKNDINSTAIAESKIYISYKNFLKVRDRL